MRLKEKVALLTGGSRGIGPVIAEEMAGRGAIMVLAARSKSGLEKVARRLTAQGHRAFIVPADLSISSERKKLIDQVFKEFGRIDILINNAGVETGGIYAEQDWVSVEETMEVNLMAPMELTRLVLPEMIKQNSGHIVNISSAAGKSGAPYAAVYSGAKAGLAGWTRALRLELAGTGVKFSTIFPGFVRDVGMFAICGMTPPHMVGSCSPSQVAEAIVNAIEKEKVEKIINSQPLRYSFALNEMFPKTGDWLMRVSGVIDFQHKKAKKMKSSGL